MSSDRRSADQGFTLLELLAVVATIATLAALLLPVLAKAKIQAQHANCTSNLRQLNTAWSSYAFDNGGWLVPCYPYNETSLWVLGDMTQPEEATNVNLITAGKLFSYAPNVGVYRCPGDQGVLIDNVRVRNVRSYSMNAFMGSRSPNAPELTGGTPNSIPFYSKDSDVQKPSEMWVFVDEDERSIDDGCFLTDPNGRVWFSFPSISSARHNFSGALGFADGHAEVWRYKDTRTRSVKGTMTEQYGNADLLRLARGATVKK